MGLTKEEAQKLLGVSENASAYLVRHRYKKLAHRYYPERNLHRKEYAYKKFQKIVEAYVRLQIDPDDCDQMKIKMILMEIYSFHEDIAGEDSSLFSEDSEDDSDPTLDDLQRVYGSASAFDSTNGPYSALLQDFTLRSYMSGGRKSKSLLNLGKPKKKLYVSEEACKRASQHAEELLKDVEEEKRKDETRRLKNKKKKEAKKKRKDRIMEESLSKSARSDESKKKKKKVADKHKPVGDKHQPSDKSESSADESGLDMESAFFSRITSKIHSSNTLILNVTDNLSEEESDDKVDIPQQPVQQAQESNDSVEMCNGTEKSNDGAENATNKGSASSKPVTVCEPNVTQHKSTRSSSGYQRNYYQSELPPRLQRKLAESKHQSSSSNNSRRTTKYTSRKSNYSSKGGKSAVKATVNQRTAKEPVEVAQQVRGMFKDDDESSLLDKSRRLAVHGNKAAKDGRFEEAIASFTEAIEIYPNDERYFGNRSFCFEYIKDYQRALEDGDAAVHLKSEWPKGHFRRGKALFGLGNYKEAELSFQKAIDLDPNYHDAVEEMKKVMEHVYPVKSASNSSPTQEEPDNNSDVVKASHPISDVVKADNPNSDVAKASHPNVLDFNAECSTISPSSFEKEKNSQPLTEKNSQLNSEKDSHTGIYWDSQSSLEEGNLPDFEQNIEFDTQEVTQSISLSNSDELSSTCANVDSLSSLLNSENTKEMIHDEDTSSQLPHAGSSIDDSKEDNENSTDNIDKSNDAAKKESRKIEKKPTADTLWIGNVDPSRIDEKLLFHTFKSCGKILKVHILVPRFCAFIQFDKPESASTALKKHKDSCIAGCHITMRYPDHSLKPKVLVHKSKPTSVVKECQYWRGSGCYYRDSCRFLHIKKNKGIDLKKRK